MVRPAGRAMWDFKKRKKQHENVVQEMERVKEKRNRGSQVESSTSCKLRLRAYIQRIHTLCE
jgi:hypothetical protein